MPLFIKLFLWIIVQHSMSMKGGDGQLGEGWSYSSFASFVTPPGYDAVAFTIRGDGGIVAGACAEQGYFMGIDGEQEIEPGVVKVQVYFRALPAARLSNIVARISQKAEVVQVETH